MRKIKFVVLVVVLLALVLVHKNPITNQDIEKMTPYGEKVEQSVTKSQNALDYLKEKLNIAWQSIKDNLGYNSDVIEGELDDSAIIENGDVEAFKLLSVIDGDTIIIDNQGVNTKVRMIGIDTPESVHEDESKNTVYGTYASDYTKELLKNVDTVYLTYDVELTDQYNRLLAYVWLEEPTDVDDINEIETKMVNYNLLANGYAVNKVYMPNNKYAEQFDIARCDAQKQEIGLWQYDEYAAMVQ